MKVKDPRTLGVVAGSALVVLVGLLVVQHLRHGWPFSLHHGLGAPASGQPVFEQATLAKLVEVHGH